MAIPRPTFTVLFYFEIGKPLNPAGNLLIASNIIVNRNQNESRHLPQRPVQPRRTP
jgi:hypothetical protein